MKTKKFLEKIAALFFIFTFLSQTIHIEYLFAKDDYPVMEVDSADEFFALTGDESVYGDGGGGGVAPLELTPELLSETLPDTINTGLDDSYYDNYGTYDAAGDFTDPYTNDYDYNSQLNQLTTNTSWDEADFQNGFLNVADDGQPAVGKTPQQINTENIRWNLENINQANDIALKRYDELVVGGAHPYDAKEQVLDLSARGALEESTPPVIAAVDHSNEYAADFVAEMDKAALETSPTAASSPAAAEGVSFKSDGTPVITSTPEEFYAFTGDESVLEEATYQETDQAYNKALSDLKFAQANPTVINEFNDLVNQGTHPSKAYDAVVTEEDDTFPHRFGIAPRERVDEGVSEVTGQKIASSLNNDAANRGLQTEVAGQAVAGSSYVDAKGWAQEAADPTSDFYEDAWLTGPDTVKNSVSQAYINPHAPSHQQVKEDIDNFNPGVAANIIRERAENLGFSAENIRASVKKNLIDTTHERYNTPFLNNPEVREVFKDEYDRSSQAEPVGRSQIAVEPPTIDPTSDDYVNSATGEVGPAYRSAERVIGQAKQHYGENKWAQAAVEKLTNPDLVAKGFNAKELGDSHVLNDVVEAARQALGGGYLSVASEESLSGVTVPASEDAAAEYDFSRIEDRQEAARLEMGSGEANLLGTGSAAVIPPAPAAVTPDTFPGLEGMSPVNIPPTAVYTPSRRQAGVGVLPGLDGVFPQLPVIPGQDNAAQQQFLQGQDLAGHRTGQVGEIGGGTLGGGAGMGPGAMPADPKLQGELAARQFAAGASASGWGTNRWGREALKDGVHAIRGYWNEVDEATKGRESLQRYLTTLADPEYQQEQVEPTVIKGVTKRLDEKFGNSWKEVYASGSFEEMDFLDDAVSQIMQEMGNSARYKGKADFANPEFINEITTKVEGLAKSFTDHTNYQADYAAKQAQRLAQEPVMPPVPNVMTDRRFGGESNTYITPPALRKEIAADMAAVDQGYNDAAIRKSKLSKDDQRLLDERLVTDLSNKRTLTNNERELLEYTKNKLEI